MLALSHDLLVLCCLIPEVFAVSISFNELLFDSALLKRNSTQEIPAPIVVPPSQYCQYFFPFTQSTLLDRLMSTIGDGDDGKWSSFALRVGTPAQDVRVLVSTNSPQTMVVLPQGCTTQAVNPIPADCASSRGGLFMPNSSTTWNDQGMYGINGGGVGLESNLGYVQNAEYGLEILGLGFAAGQDGPTLKNQTVAGIASVSPFYTYVKALAAL